MLHVRIDGDTKIRDITITGDFFLHPEDVLPAIERSLVGKSFDTSIEDIAEDITEVLYKKDANFVGVSPQNIAELIDEAVNGQNGASAV